MGKELTSLDAVRCAQYVEDRVVASFLAKVRPLEVLVREWMIEHCQGSSTTRVDFEEAVRRILFDAHGQ